MHVGRNDLQVTVTLIIIGYCFGIAASSILAQQCTKSLSSNPAEKPESGMRRKNMSDQCASGSAIKAFLADGN